MYLEITRGDIGMIRVPLKQPVYHGENGGSLLGWWPSCLTPARSPSNGDIPNKYPLYKMHGVDY